MVNDEVRADVRARLALRLDESDPAVAVGLATELAPYFGVAKVGIDLLVGGGPQVVADLRRSGLAVFCDFKLHDIPDQVEASARAIGRLGVAYATMHCAGGPEMLSAGVRGFERGASEAGEEPPVALGVTVLTSEPDTSAFDQRLDWAVRSGCGGVVCSAYETATVKGAHPGLVVVTPGIRMPASRTDDQARTATPGAAIASGADLLVVGRVVVDAERPQDAARDIAAEVEAVIDAGVPGAGSTPDRPRHG